MFRLSVVAFGGLKMVWCRLVNQEERVRGKEKAKIDLKVRMCVSG